MLDLYTEDITYLPLVRFLHCILMSYRIIFCFVWNKTGESMVFFRSIGESESENMHLARLWREGSPERQLVALSAELRRSGLLLNYHRDSPSLSERNTKSLY